MGPGGRDKSHEVSLEVTTAIHVRDNSVVDGHWFLTGYNIAPSRAQLAMSGDVLSCHN